jgi:hypothetical protein
LTFPRFAQNKVAVTKANTTGVTISACFNAKTAGAVSPALASACHFSATVLECATLGLTPNGLHRGGCHEGNPERSSAFLLLGRVRYGDCDCGRDPTHLTEVCARQRWSPTILGRNTSYVILKVRVERRLGAFCLGVLCLMYPSSRLRAHSWVIISRRAQEDGACG